MCSCWFIRRWCGWKAAERQRDVSTIEVVHLVTVCPTRQKPAVSARSLWSSEVCFRLWNKNKPQDSFSTPDKRKIVPQLCRAVTRQARHKGRLQHSAMQWQEEERNGTTESKLRPLCRLTSIHFLLLVDDTVEVVSISCWLTVLKGMLRRLSCPKKGVLTPSLKALWSLSVLRTVGRWR